MVKPMQEQIDSGPLIGKAKKNNYNMLNKNMVITNIFNRIFFPQTDAIQASIH